MKNLQITFLLIVIVSTFHACSSNSEKKKAGISIRQTNDDNPSNLPSNEPFANFKTRPSNVLLTGNNDHRLVTVYKVNYDAKRKKTFIGSNRFHRTYSNSYYDENPRRHQHFMPGIEAVYGYNMMNVAHYNFKTKQQNNLFEAPVLINTLYYPSFLQDSLNNEPAQRDYYMVSVYDEDTNQDSLINRNDLRRFYRFDMEGEHKSALVPINYSVMSSEYDAVNDLMFVFARLDENKNGRREDDEPMHIFYFDLESPQLAERLY